MASEQVDVQVTVRTIMTNYKRDPLEVAFQYPSPVPAQEIAVKREIDPDYVGVQLLFQGKDKRDFVLNMVLSKEYANQLNLMVGDKMTLKLVKDNEK